MEYMESMMQSRHQAFEDMIQEYYDELDATICNCMAAGVSADRLVLTTPKLDHNFDNSVCVTAYFGFKPEHLVVYE